MSRIGKNKITVPSGVEVNFDKGILTVKGPKGELKRDVRREVDIVFADGEIEVKKVAENALGQALWGTYASHAKNMVQGVTEGFKKQLEINGVGYKAEMKDGKLHLKVGFSHPVVVDVPEGLTVETKDNKISVEGFDKELVGKFASETRAIKKPEPYKGKGIKYIDEVIRRKQGKKA